MNEFFTDIYQTKAYTADDFGKDTKILQTVGRTIPYLSDFALDENRTQAYHPEPLPEKKTANYQLAPGDKVELNSISYTVSGIIAEEGKNAEAAIYKVKNPKDEVFVLKLYYEFSNPRLEPNSDTLQRIREINSHDILRLFDFGTGPNKHLEKYCFEIVDFAAGGDLLNVADIPKKYTPDFISEKVVQSVADGLRTLHAEKIYHCDLKPQNVFFLDAEQSKIVIGDYGSAKSFEKSSHKELSYTTITKGTEFYLAPEQAFGIVSEKNDYYSLGMIVLHLLYPDQVNRENLRRIFERRTKGLPIIDFDDRFKRLNMLIQGLTLQDYNSRWGEKELSRWLAGEEVEVNYNLAGHRQVLKIGEIEIKTGDQLAAYIRSDPFFFDELIEDREGYSMLLAWLKNMQGEQNAVQFDGMVSYYKKYFGFDYVKEALLFYFDPAHQVSVGLETFRFAVDQDIETAASNFFKTLDALWKTTDFEVMRFYFFRFEFAMRRLRVKSGNESQKIIDFILNKIAAIVETANSVDFSELKADIYIHLKDQHFCDFFYLFDARRNFKDLCGHEYTSLFELDELLRSNPPGGKTETLHCEKHSFLRQRVSREDLLEFFEFSDTAPGFFRDKEVDYRLLLELIHKFTKPRYSLPFLQQVVAHYKNSPPRIFTALVLRLLDPERAIKVSGKEILLHQHGDFKNKLEDFFEALNRFRLTASIEQVRTLFFDFELCMMQIAADDAVFGQKQAALAFGKIQEILQVQAPDMQLLKASFYPDMREEQLLEIIYAFLPAASFCNHLGDYLSSGNEIALYYLQYPGKYNEKSSTIEREIYLKKAGQRGLLDLSFKDFIMRVFHRNAFTDVSIENMVFDEQAANELSVYYVYSGSIQNYLESLGYHLDFDCQPSSQQKVTLPIKMLTSDTGLYQKFATHLHHHHAIGNLDPNLESQFLSKFEVLKQRDFRASFSLVPRYMLHLLPPFALLFLASAYLFDFSFFKQLSFSISPALNMVSARLATANFSSLLFSAYFVNLWLGIAFLLPVFSLKYKRKQFENFTLLYSSLISKLTTLLVFAPVLFIAGYYFSNLIFGDSIFILKWLNLTLGTSDFIILLYILFMLYQSLQVVHAIFRAFGKIRIVPLLIAVCAYLLLYYFTIINQNLYVL